MSGIFNTTNTHEMTCPHCGEEYPYPGEYFGGVNLALVTCETCGEQFDAERHIDGLFSTTAHTDD